MKETELKKLDTWNDQFFFLCVFCTVSALIILFLWYTFSSDSNPVWNYIFGFVLAGGFLFTGFIICISFLLEDKEEKRDENGSGK